MRLLKHVPNYLNNILPKQEKINLLRFDLSALEVILVSSKILDFSEQLMQNMSQKYN